MHGAALCAMIAMSFFFGSCDDELDIVPKGKVTLSTLDEVELLLNQEYSINDFVANSLCLLTGESLGAFDNINSVVSQTNTLKYAYMTFDSSVDRVALTSTDDRYNSIYRYVNYMNVVIANTQKAEGDSRRKESLIAEARVMRAYMHWLAVCIYARQYDKATAEKDGGVPYVTSTQVTETKEKLSLAEVYRLILDDVSDEVINALPDRSAASAIRGDKAWGNAVRAVVLLQMKRYEDALPYALEAIRLHPAMFDRSSIKTTGKWQQDQTSPNNFIYMSTAIRVSPTTAMIPRETYNLFSPDDYVIKYDATGWSKAVGESTSGMKDVYQYNGWTAQNNVYGLTSEQLRFVAAECYIRKGETAKGLALVDEVRQMRIEGCLPLVASDERQAMAEMQKAKFVECLVTPFNFFDIKRWNTEAPYRRTVVRKLPSIGTFSLAPDSPLWIMPFPANAVRYNPTLTQNY